jgi:ubiquinone/menaquinone biosynthesis C-methylase UbiE
VLEDTGERLIPQVHAEQIGYAEHLTRYLAAVPLCEGKDVLDIASGSGYGSRELAAAARSVIGVDISQEAVDYAKEHFPADNLEYRVGSGTSIPLDDDSVDVVITFETIEHIDDYRTFVAEIRRVLRPGGVAVVSTPNDLEYEENNHFHLHEFERAELLDLLRPDFPVIEEYFQATWKYVALDRLDALGETSERRTVNLAPIQPEQLRYFYFVCSDAPIDTLPEPIAGLGEHYSEKRQIELMQELAALRAEVQEIKASRSFRLAHGIAKVVRPGR